MIKTKLKLLKLFKTFKTKTILPFKSSLAKIIEANIEASTWTFGNHI